VSIRLSTAQTRSLAAVLKPRAGRHRLPELPGLLLVIEKTKIKDSDDNVVEEIG
jgi:hypothetical protein